MSLSFDLERSVREVLSYDTGTQGGPRELLGYLMDLLYYGDFRIVEQAAAFSDADHTNLVGIRGQGPAMGGLLLCSSIVNRPRLDPLAWSETEEDPFNPTIRDGLLFGYGASGPRVDLVCRILAAASVDREELKRPVIIAGLFGPDARVGGAMYLLDSGICVPQWALVSEGTDLELVHAHRGQLVLRLGVELGPDQTESKRTGRAWRLEVAGEPAHAASPGLGQNAIDRALRILARFRSRGAGFTIHRLEAAHTPDRIPDACVVHLHSERLDWAPWAPGLIAESLGDSAELGPALDDALETWHQLITRLHELFRWTAPDTAPDFLPSTPIYSLAGAMTSPDQLHLVLDYRTLPGQRIEQLTRDVESLARRLSSPGHRITVDVERNLLPMDGSDDCHLVEVASSCLRELSVPPVTSTYGGYAEGWIFNAAGIETLLFGPGSTLAQGHRPNEHAAIQQIRRAAAFYERLIRRLCT